MIRRYEPALLLLWSMLAGALAFGDVDHPIRSAVVLGFVALGPGLALVRLLGFEDYTTRLLLALPTSLALAAVVSAFLVYGGLPTWDLGLSALIAVAVGAIALDLAHPGTIFAPRPAPASKRKLDDESRQAALINMLMDGGTLDEAADAAGVSMATLQRALQSSDRLRRAASVASRGRLDAIGARVDGHVEAAGADGRAIGT
jgi:hypothetical protein